MSYSDTYLSFEKKTITLFGTKPNFNKYYEPFYDPKINLNIKYLNLRFFFTKIQEHKYYLNRIVIILIIMIFPNNNFIITINVKNIKK